MRALIISEHKADHLRCGFKAAGYALVQDISAPRPDDVLVTWNRKPINSSRIEFFEAAGAKVIVAENGYIGRDDQGVKLISLSHNHHLGAGCWHIGEEARHHNHNFKVSPWRAGGEEIVLLAQRGIGNSKRLEWSMDLAEKIKSKTMRPVRVRAHPGKAPKGNMEHDIENAHAVVTYSSSAALYALAFGVPVFYLMKDWIGAEASIFGISDLENPLRGDREKVFHRIGWAQWTVDEIRSGKAIKAVMEL